MHTNYNIPNCSITKTNENNHFYLTKLFPPLIDLKSPFFVRMLIAWATRLALNLSKLDVKFATVTSFPMQTLFLMASSIFSISAVFPCEKVLENYFPSIVFIVETWNK
jgi:hypothetical protein